MYIAKKYIFLEIYLLAEYIVPAIIYVGQRKEQTTEIMNETV